MTYNLTTDLINTLDQLREKKPLIHIIPNNVSATFCADALASIGARPIMALSPLEVEEISQTADAIVLNLGQPTTEKIEALKCSARIGARNHIPVVFDPVGVGASSFRLENALALLDIPWQGIVRLNRSEYTCLSTRHLTHTGVDSHSSLANDLSSPRVDLTYLITGKEDLIISSNQRAKVKHLDEFAPNIVGTGCVLGALCGAFVSLGTSHFIAAITASFVMSVATYKTGLLFTHAHLVPYGSYKQCFLDTLSTLSSADVEEFSKRLITVE